MPHVQTTEEYLHSVSNSPKQQLAMTAFPAQGFSTTECKNNYMTDSAASGTALATGYKTGYSVLGIDETGGSWNGPSPTVCRKKIGATVPVFALGVGQDQFNGYYDNTDIPCRLARQEGKFRTNAGTAPTGRARGGLTYVRWHWTSANPARTRTTTILHGPIGLVQSVATPTLQAGNLCNPKPHSGYSTQDRTSGHSTLPPLLHHSTTPSDPSPSLYSYICLKYNIIMFCFITTIRLLV